MPTDIAHKHVSDAPREQKSFAVPQVDISDDQPGVIEAIVGVFGNVDLGGDRVRPGFFAKSIARKLPKIAWGHDHLTPVGKTIEARELYPGDPALPPSLLELGGLYVKGQFNLDTQRGREAYSDVKFGAIDEFSFGYRATEFEIDKKAKIRDLIEGDIFEWSPVLAGMNNRTRLLSVKAAEVEAEPTSRAAHKSAKAEKASKESRLVTGRTLLDHSRDVVTAIGGLKKRVEDRAEFRSVVPRHADEDKAGAMFSRQNRTALEGVSASCKETAAAIDDILARDLRSRPADEPATDAAKAKADASPGEAKPAEMPAPAPQAAIEPATPAVALPAPVEPAIPPASVPAPGPDDADILAQYALTRQAVTTALVGSLIPHA